jgi:ribosomal protein S14
VKKPRRQTHTTQSLLKSSLLTTRGRTTALDSDKLNELKPVQRCVGHDKPGRADESPAEWNVTIQLPIRTRWGSGRQNCHLQARAASQAADLNLCRQLIRDAASGSEGLRTWFSDRLLVPPDTSQHWITQSTYPDLFHEKHGPQCEISVLSRSQSSVSWFIYQGFINWLYSTGWKDDYAELGRGGKVTVYFKIPHTRNQEHPTNTTINRTRALLQHITKRNPRQKQLP